MSTHNGALVVSISDVGFGFHARLRLEVGGTEEGGASKMDGVQDILLGKWHELKGQVREQWGKITDDDFTRLSGKTEELAGVLQQRYGYEKSKADAEINDWIRGR